MAELEKKRIYDQIIEAEMNGNLEKVADLRVELAALKHAPAKPATRVYGPQRPPELATQTVTHTPRPPPINFNRQLQHRDAPLFARKRQEMKHDPKVRKFLQATGSLSTMFAQARTSTSSEEARGFFKTAAMFSRDDMETKHFSEEVDNTEYTLNKHKRHKSDQEAGSSSRNDPSSSRAPDQRRCAMCKESQPSHLVVDAMEFAYMALIESKPFLSSVSNVIIRNTDHSCGSFVAASNDHQADVERLMGFLRSVWKRKGYRSIFMETYFKNHRPSFRDLMSGGNHFQIHCIPIREKYFEKARMCFKNALQSSGSEWSLNKRLITADGRRIQRYLPKGLSYFWVSFDSLHNGFGHVIENEPEFARHFGFEVLAGLLDRDFHPSKLTSRQPHEDQLARSRDFQSMYSSNEDDMHPPPGRPTPPPTTL